MINPAILARFPPERRKWLSETAQGQKFYSRIIGRKGIHISINGKPDSGKTNVGHWFMSYLKELETIVVIDTCKDEEILPLFNMGKDVNIICPSYCNVEVKNVPCNVTVQTAFTPDICWRLAKPGIINIMSINQFIKDRKKRASFYAGLFQSLSDLSYDGFFETIGIDRMTVWADEAQKVVPSQALTSIRERIDAAHEVAENIMEDRAFGVRMVLGTQQRKQILPLARQNMLVNAICNGAEAGSSDPEIIRKVCKYAQYYEVGEVLVVFPNGDYIPRTCPWKVPLMERPKGSSVRYVGRFDIEHDQEAELIAQGGRYDFTMNPPEKEVVLSRYSQEMES